jgi:flagellar protein FlbD
MILLTRLDGSRIALNEDQIERLDETPDTVITLVNGNAYLVVESLEEVIDRIAEFQARSSPSSGGTRPRARSAARRAAHLQLAGREPEQPEEH